MSVADLLPDVSHGIDITVVHGHFRPNLARQIEARIVHVRGDDSELTFHIIVHDFGPRRVSAAHAPQLRAKRWRR